ncbi:MAG: helix-turn-helix domain-containing protein [Planctomycetes bacterium]|nr:helix-turn-helix domain-containing protein [Planctomycetota bacterium]
MGYDDKPTQNLERLLTYTQAGELLGVSSRTVWNYVERGELGAIRFGGIVRVDPQELRAFIERSKHYPKRE